MSRPGGVYYWAPEIPSANTIAGAMPSKCELAHNRDSFFPKWRGLRPPLVNRKLTVRVQYKRDRAGGHSVRE
jgi:hypothetical protein